MQRDLPQRYADALVSRSKLVIVLLLVATVVVGAGAVTNSSGESATGQTGIDSKEQAALEEIRSTYATDDAVITQIVVRDEGGDVLTRESLLKSLRLQQSIRKSESIDATLRAETGVVGLENLVATAAYLEDQRASTSTHQSTAANRAGQSTAPTLKQQIEALESRSPGEVEALLAQALDQGATTPGREPTAFLPSDYESGTTNADARVTLMFQAADADSSNGTPQEAYDAQVAIA